MLQICEKTTIFYNNVDLVNENVYTKFVLKISGKKFKIQKSINDHNSVAKLKKKRINNTNVDLVNDGVCTKFGLILSICSQVLRKKKTHTTDSGLNQGP